MKLFTLALPALAVALPLYAQTPAVPSPEPRSGSVAGRDEPWAFTVYWENDGGILKRNNIEDRHYTNGVGVSFAHQPQWAERVNDWLPAGDEFDRTAGGYLFGQLMFTPDNISTSALVADDRPYAGYLFGAAYFQRANDTTFDHIQLEVGIVGPSSKAEEVQDTVHAWTKGIEPNGWDNQIEDEPTIQTYYRRKWRFDLYDDRGERPDGYALPELQAIPQAGVALGTVHRYVEAGATLRLGVNLPDDFGPGRLADVAAFTAPRRDAGWYAYGFARVLGRAVEHNLFLEGNTWKDSHGVEEEPLIAEGSLGIALGYRGDRWTGELVYSQTAATEEFEGQDGGDQYGSLLLSITGWF